MANVTAKTSSNIFYKARCEAATHNEQLSSREGAADYMSIDRGRLYRIESGIAVPYPEEIRLMADLYNAPELENYFCRTMCPLGCEMPKAELARATGIRPNTISELYHEYTDRVNLEHLDLICEALHCELDELIVRVPNDYAKITHTRSGSLISSDK